MLTQLSSGIYEPLSCKSGITFIPPLSFVFLLDLIVALKGCVPVIKSAGSLSQDERRVISLLSAGFNFSHIATALNISQKTVYSIKDRALTKLSISPYENMATAVRAADIISNFC
ncbi:hypothetical protein BTJ39_17300 [Izhakiella australiensis]|uniref:HTH luxR-type domain-containing protein n=1 Tax=Izhakiella australiensis TaxID=1926881 RepID=A0A1S8YIS8_9GAMM|nr:hypothetical protein BTJ39_17300 [Izhakiella australiensis]